MSTTGPTSPAPIAIIGIGCLFPRADGPGAFWANVRNKVDAIGPVPESHWKPADYFDADPKSPDRTYANRGGFLDPVDFPPLDFGITPNALEATDSTQLLGLMAARQALADAGYTTRAFDRSRVGVILGVTGTLELVIPLGARLGHPIWRRALKDAGVAADVAEDVVKRIGESYVGWQEDSFPGLLGNVAAGRIANRLDLGGTNCVVDAACASSLSAVHLAMLELATGRADMVLTGGLDTFNDIFMYMCFSKTPALSPTGNAKPFDASADGTILGEGLGCLVLKRLADAERDGDRVYAVIKGIGTSSDGKGQAVYAPSPVGQARALRQAYEIAGVTPDTIELVEAHGTGTKAGDAAEVTALTEVYRSSGRSGSWCAIGSVKSQMGHTKAAAGVAGLIKAALAIYHRVLPPTIKINKPIEAVTPGRGPFYINTEKRPWLPRAEHPRRAAVSAFGFGGSNFHCVLEECPGQKAVIDWDGDVQLVAFSASTPQELWARADAFPREAKWEEVRAAAARSRQAFDAAQPYRLVGVLERGQTDTGKWLANARAVWDKQPLGKGSTPDGVFWAHGSRPGPLAMLFPGQGSQYVGMMRDLACQFPQVLDALAEADAGVLADRIFPPPAFADEERKAQEEALRATDVAQPALGAMALGALRVLAHFGVRAEAYAGHSYGELVALHAAGRFDSHTLHALSRRRGQLMSEGSGDRGSMLAVQAPLADIQHFIRTDVPNLVLANRNAPRQAILSGPTADIRRAAELLGEKKIGCKQLPVAAAFHSSLVAGVRQPFGETLAKVEFKPATVPVYANTTGQPYPSDAAAARALLAGQLAEPVAFVTEIENMYTAGLRTFVEVGPGKVLTGLVGAILEGREHTAIALDASVGRRSGTADLARTLAQLSALGYAIDLALWDGDFVPPAPKKPTMTVPISGANYVKPRSPRPPVVPSVPPVPSVAPPKPAVSPVNGGPKPTVSQNGNHPAAPPVATAPPARPATNGHNGHNGANHAIDGHTLGHALRATQDNLVALQKMGEQTARLHGQFLEGQDRALTALHSLMEQQQRLVHLAIGSAPPVPTVPAPVVKPVVPVVKQTPVVQPAIAAPPVAPAALSPAPIALPPALPVTPPKALAAPPTSAPAPAVGSNASKVLLEVVAQKTGYPAEMLALEMELDADLGIDSIKRVEIFSALQERLPEAPVVKPEHLGTLRTLRDVVEFLGNAGPSVGAASRVAPRSDIQEASPGSAAPGPARLAGPTENQAEGVTTVLLAVVADKTGYPAEMLALEMELDADLGIDSIKRVEIFSALQERLPEAPVVKPEHLGTLRTLRDVVEFLGATGPSVGAARLAAPRQDLQEPSSGSAAPGPARLAGPTSDSNTVRRFILEAVPLEPTPRPALRLAPRAEIWVAGNESTLTTGIVSRLTILGFQARVLTPSEWPLREPSAQLAGLVVCASETGTDDTFIKDAFRLLQRTAPRLRASGQAGGALFATLSRLDGTFGIAHGSGDIVSGALAGLAKTAAHEWPEVACKAIDLQADASESDDAVLASVEELLKVGPVEVGWSQAGRSTLQVTERAVDGPVAEMPFHQGEVVVVSGGARGVTAEVAVAVARASHATLLLLGRSPQPTPEPDWLAGLNDDGDIKRELLAHGGPAAPKDLGEQYRRALANREVLHNLRRIEQAGGQALYRQLDVRDAAAVATVLAEVRAKNGPIVGLVHGAGVLADRRIEDKTAEQFASVWDTKVGGLRALLTAMATDALRAIALFSSSTGRFGRSGQVDYAAANELLNKVAQAEARRRSDCRVVSLNWGPWDGGMVTPGLKKVFAGEGVGVIPLAEGADFFVRELRTAGPVEVVVLAGDVPGLSAPAPASTLPIALEREFSAELLPVLQAHVIAGRAVLPMALGVEWMGHAALHANPGLVFLGCDDLRVLKGLRLAEGERCLVRARAGKAVKVDTAFRVPVELRSVGASGKETLHVAATILLANKLPTPEAAPPLPVLRHYGRSVQAAYEQVLFHGPALRGISRVDGCSEQGIAAMVAAAPVPSEWLKQPLRGSWIADPLALDGAFQMMILWSQEAHGAPSLPCGAGQYRQYVRAFPREGTRIVARITRTVGPKISADLWFLDGRGAVVARMSDYECVIDPALAAAFRRNRLTPEALPSS